MAQFAEITFWGFTLLYLKVKHFILLLLIKRKGCRSGVFIIGKSHSSVRFVIGRRSGVLILNISRSGVLLPNKRSFGVLILNGRRSGIIIVT